MSTTISSQPATNLGYFEPLPFDFIDLATINLSFFEALPFYQTLDSFELFPKLPGELQVMIGRQLLQTSQSALARSGNRLVRLDPTLPIPST